MNDGVDIIFSHDAGKLAVVAVHHLGKRSEQNIALFIVTFPKLIDHSLLVSVIGDASRISAVNELRRIGYIEVVCFQVIGNNACRIGVLCGHIPVILMVKGVGIFQRLIIVVDHCGNVGLSIFVPDRLIAGINIVIDTSGIWVGAYNSGDSICISREIEFQTGVGSDAVCRLIDVIQ